MKTKTALKFSTGRILNFMLAILLISCQNGKNEMIKNTVWRSINTDVLDLSDEDHLFMDNLGWYKETALGPLFWQLEILDTSIIEYKSRGFNKLEKREIKYELNKDTLKLFYPRDYVFDKFTKSGRYIRLHREKWLMQENNDTLTLSLISVIYTFSGKEYFYDTKTAYKFVKPKNKLEFPAYFFHTPENNQEIIAILNNLYSDKGKAELLQNFKYFPENEKDFVSYGIRQSMISGDLCRVFDFENDPSLQHWFKHYHPEVIAGRFIGIYLTYLENEKEVLNSEEK